jgi:hypothetical protein
MNHIDLLPSILPRLFVPALCPRRFLANRQSSSSVTSIAGLHAFFVFNTLRLARMFLRLRHPSAGGYPRHSLAHVFFRIPVHVQYSETGSLLALTPTFPTLVFICQFIAGQC